MPQTGYCTDVTCIKELTELYECHCCSWLICLRHLLEHVKISKRDKQAQLDTLRNDLKSMSNTLELIMEKKLHEIEHEKQLINQAKTIINKSTHTIEEIQLISKEINQAIASNRNEETSVKVEPSLLDMRTSSCTSEISNETNGHKKEVVNLCSYTPSNIILQQPISSTNQILRRRTNEFEKSTTSENNYSDMINMNDDIMDFLKDEADDDHYHDQENISNGEIRHNQCPLTFDGAFGLTKANHSIELCTIGNTFPHNFIGHLTWKHKLKKACSLRLYEAMKQNQNPFTTKLFNENEDVIDHDRYIPCPFSNSMINLTECHAPPSRKIPCSCNSIAHFLLVRHLTKYHEFPLHMAQKIKKKHEEKFSKMICFNRNNAHSA